MPDLAEIRQQYPQYHDMADGQLADALHSKFYSDMPRDEFNAKIKFNPVADNPTGIGGPGVDTTQGLGLEMQRQLHTVPQEAAKGAPVVGAAVPTTSSMKDFEENQPVLAAGARGLGAAAALAPAMAAAPELFGMSAALPLTTNVAAGAATSGLIGAADAAARGEPIVQGGVTGALTGGAAPIVGKGIGAAFKGIANLLTPEATGVLKGINPKALDELATAMKDDGLTEAQIGDMINKKGVKALLAEYSPRLKGAAQAVASSPGAQEGKEALVGAFESRAAPEARSARITQGINEGLGEPVNMTQAAIENAAQREKEGGPLFEQFRGMKVTPTKDVKTLTGQLDELGYLNDAKRIAKEEAAATGKPVAPTENFFTTGEQKDWPTTKSWSYVKQAVDNKIANSYDAHGLPTQTTRRLRDLKARIDDVIGNSSPETKAVWDEARGIWENSKALDNARAEGKNVWNPNYTKDQLLEDLTRMTPAERAAHKEAARAALAEKAGNFVEGTGEEKVGNILRTANNKDKFTYLSMKKGYDPEQFINNLDHMAAEKKSFSELGTNTQKEASKEMKERLTPNPKKTAVGRILERFHYAPHVSPLSYIPVVNSIQNMLARRQAGQYEGMINAIGKLTAKSGPEAQEIARALLKYAPRGAGAGQAGLTTSGVVNALARPNTPGVPLPWSPQLGGTNQQ